MMEREELIQSARKLYAEGDSLGAMDIVYRAYEAGVAEHRALRDNAQNSVGFKAAAEMVRAELSPDCRADVGLAMEAIREAVFSLVQLNPEGSTLLWEYLTDYTREELKAYRDFVVNNAKRMLVPDEVADEEAAQPTLSVDDLDALRKNVAAFWNLAGEPKLAGDKDDPHAPRTKELKGGTKLEFSNLPREEGTKDVPQDGIQHSRLVYSVDGQELRAGTSLSEIGLMFVSSPDWTVSVADIKAEVSKQLGAEYGDVTDFTVEVNGHIISRERVAK